MLWLSFADPTRPRGQHFLGACLIEVADGSSILSTATRLGLNPGGQVMVLCLDPEVAQLIPDRWKNRLLDREECAELDEELLALQKAAGILVRPPEAQFFICEKHNVKKGNA